MENIDGEKLIEELTDLVEAAKEYLRELNCPTQNYHLDMPSVCDGCANNPKNGGSGICNCTLPYMQNPTNYTVQAGDYVMVNSTGGYVYTTSTKLPDASTPTINIADAVERTKQYLKE